MNIQFQPNMGLMQRLMAKRQSDMGQMPARIPVPAQPVLPAQQNYPGQWSGASMQQWQQMNRDGWKTRGYILPLEANKRNEFLVNINGQAREFFGISFKSITSWDDDSTMPTVVNLMVNSEQIMQDHPWVDLDKKYQTGYPFYPFHRLLSGADNIKLSIDNGALIQNVAVTWWYKSL